MKEAGGIMLAVTNVSELAMWWESNNNVYGRSRNPYNFDRIVGGSSGGEVSAEVNYPNSGNVIAFVPGCFIECWRLTDWYWV